MIKIKLAFALSGCIVLSACVADQNRYVFLGNGVSGTIHDLKVDYTKKTGKELPEPDTSSCFASDSCYYRKWREVYDSEISVINARQKEAAQNAQWEQMQKRSREEQELRSCLKNESCSKRLQANIATEKLRSQYQALMNVSYGNAGEADSTFRQLCGPAAAAQKKGMPRSEITNRARDFPGVPPYYRQFFVETVLACWDSSKAGVNWQEAIRVY